MKIKLALVFWLTLTMYSAYSQEPEVEILKLKREGINVLDQVTVLKSDNNVRHGAYSSYLNGTRVIKGQYNQGKKDGVWLYKSPLGIPIAEGKYLNDERVGEWVFYSKRKRLVQRYDYDKKELTHYNVKRERTLNPGFDIIIPDEFPSLASNQPPILIGGVQYYKTIIETNLALPEGISFLSNDEKVVYVSITINTEGKLKDVKMARATHPALEKEAIRVVSMLDNWIPAIKESELIESTVIVPLEYY